MMTQFKMRTIGRRVFRRFRWAASILVLAVTCAACAEAPESSNELVQRVPQESTMPEVIVRIEENTETPSTAAGEELDKIPELVKFEHPKYPDLPRAAGFGGVSEVEIIVDEHGGVRDARILSRTAPLIMDDPVLQAVRQFEYKPAIQNGKAVECRLVYRFHFEIATLNDD